MDANSIIQLVSSVGFPVLAYFQLFKFVQSRDDKHREEVAELRTAIENNTRVVERLLERSDITNGI